MSDSPDTMVKTDKYQICPHCDKEIEFLEYRMYESKSWGPFKMSWFSVSCPHCNKVLSVTPFTP